MGLPASRSRAESSRRLTAALRADHLWVVHTTVAEALIEPLVHHDLPAMSCPEGGAPPSPHVGLCLCRC